MDHCMGGGATGLIPGHEDKITLGHRPNGIYVPRFRNVKQKHSGLLRGKGSKGGDWRQNWEEGAGWRGFEEDFKRWLSGPVQWMFPFYGLGGSCPNPKNSTKRAKEKP